MKRTIDKHRNMTNEQTQQMTESVIKVYATFHRLLVGYLYRLLQAASHLRLPVLQKKFLWEPQYSPAGTLRFT